MTSVVMDIIARDHFSQQFIKAGAEAEGLAKKVSTTGSRIGSAMKVGAAVGVAALVTIATASVELASKFEDSQKRLEAALKSAGSSFEDLKAPIAAANKNMEKLGFTNTQTADALANLTVATKNPTKSIQLLGLAADLARFKHIDLATAATAVGKAMAGNLKPIKQLGIDLPVAASSALKVATATTNLGKAQDAYNAALATYQKTPTAANYAKMEAASKKLGDAQDKLNTTTGASNIILKTLSDRLGGQAQAAASTLAGKTEVLRARLEDVGIKIGTKLIPPLITLVGWMSSVLSFFERHSTAAKVLAGVLGGALVLAIGHVVVAWVAANLAFIATPIGAVITAIVALVAALILLWKHWDQIWGWISRHKAYAILIAAILSILLPISLLVTAVFALLKHWDTVWTTVVNIINEAKRIIFIGVKAIIDVFFSMVQSILHGAAAAFGWIPGLGGKLKQARNSFDDFKSGVDRNFQDMIDATSRAQGKLGSLQGTIDGLHGKIIPVQVRISSFSGGPGGTPGPAAVAGGGFARGGKVQGPGGEMSDSILALLSHNEYVVNAASARKHAALLDMINRDKLPGYANGGIVITMPSSALVSSLTAGIENKAANKYAASIPISQLFGGAGGPATAGGNLSAWIAAAIAVTGSDPFIAAAVQRRIMFESGGNPNAINLWDSNAMAGDPSRGLMQTIGSTFNAYHQPGTSWNIYDPVANIAAALNYIRSRYGSIYLIDPPVQGYATGGMVDRTGLAFLHRGEEVLPAGYRGGGVVIAPGAITIYAAPGMDEARVAEQAFARLRAWVADEQRRAAKGGRA